MKFTVPKSMLVGDNGKFGVINGRLLLSRRYRDAKAALHLHLLAQARRQKAHPLDGRVRLRGVVVWPDNHRRDMTMFVKVLHDALEGVAYHDDVQIWDYAYVRGENDRASPRVELVIEALG